MASCEKCWDDAARRAFENPEKLLSEHYHDLIAERKDNPCTPEEQAGRNSNYCNRCERWTVHQHTGKCILCERDRDIKIPQ